MKVLLPLLLTVALTGCDTPSPTEADTSLADPTEVPTPGTTPEADNTDYRDITTDDDRIATALLAAPEASRDGARVIGYNAAGELVTLREGSNEFICLADDPNKDGFSAACYHRSLEPFMARGRELKARGRASKEVFATREEEVKSGKLSMGDMGSTLHVYYGPSTRYDAIAGRVEDAQYRYVVYMPFATAASTGLPESPIAPNHPWIMDPGTHTAHIMISPLRGQ